MIRLILTFVKQVNIYCIVLTSGGSRITETGGANFQGGGESLLFGQNFPKNGKKMKEFRPGGGGHVPDAPLGPPLLTAMSCLILMYLCFKNSGVRELIKILTTLFITSRHSSEYSSERNDRNFDKIIHYFKIYLIISFRGVSQAPHWLSGMVSETRHHQFASASESESDPQAWIRKRGHGHEATTQHCLATSHGSGYINSDGQGRFLALVSKKAFPRKLFGLKFWNLHTRHRPSFMR